MSGLAERLLEPDWHDPKCPFARHCYCDEGAPHDRVMHPLAREAADHITRLESDVEVLRAALADVVDPIGYLRRYAEAEGSSLSGAAYQIANDIGFVQKVAREALSRISGEDRT